MALVQAIAKRVGPHHKLITAACYFAAVVLLCIFPSFDRKTEVEEHALIPAYAESRFTNTWPRVLRQSINKFAKAASVDEGLSEALFEAELITHRLNFTVLDNVRGSLVYALVPSRRGDSREAVVVIVATPTSWKSVKQGRLDSAWGLGIGVTLAQYLQTVQWLSKDVFFVFVDGTLPYGAGVRAWVRAYFGGSSAMRRGVLRQAVVLDTDSRPLSFFCDVEGINGMVPNQDIVNTFMMEAGKVGLSVQHREVWDSILHHFWNGGVHSSHAPFLELQVPAFTVRGNRERGTVRSGREIEPTVIAQSMEGIVRCLSNNFQQLHHSFNFYFFTGARKHISSGIFLYPIFAMQLPLVSFLMVSPVYREIRSLLVGLGSNVAIMVVSGSPLFFIATDASLSRFLGSLSPAASDGLGEVACEHQPDDGGDAKRRRRITATWLSCGAAAALVLALLLRRYAFSFYKEDDGGAKRGDMGGTRRLPTPLWEAILVASGFHYLVILAPVTIYSWSVAVPLTVICVPVLILARPLSIRERPIRSLALAAFLVGNFILITFPPTLRVGLPNGGLGAGAAWAFEFYHKVIVPAVPREARPYLPSSLVAWLQAGALTTALEQDLLVGLHEAARDFHCVGGMLFPVFCFVYWPFLVLVTIVGVVLPAQRVDRGGLTLRQLLQGVLLLLALLLICTIGGVFWRSHSSAGLGQLQWS